MPALTDGALLWKKRGGLDERMILGNERLTSKWPARGGVAVVEDTVYFAAGIWPSDGIFLYALAIWIVDKLKLGLRVSGFVPALIAAVVIGGGVAGMTAALSLADQGFQATLVENTSQLGGAARDVGQTEVRRAAQ